MLDELSEIERTFERAFAITATWLPYDFRRNERVTITITPTLLDQLEDAIQPRGKDGVTRMIYFLKDVDPEFHETNTVDVILALVQCVKEQNATIERLQASNGHDEDDSVS